MNLLEMGLLILDRKDRIIFANQAFINIFHLDRRLVKKKNPSPFKTLTPLEQIYNSFKNDLNEHSIESLPVKIDPLKVIYISGFIGPLYENKKFYGSICTFIDITALAVNKAQHDDYALQMEKHISRKTSDLILFNEKLKYEIKKLKDNKKELKDTIKMYETIFQETMKGICRFTPDGMLIEANQPMAEMLGFKSSDEFKNSVNQGKTTIFADIEWEYISQKLLSEKKIIEMETELVSCHRPRFWAGVSGLVILSKRKQTFFELMFTDISQRKKNDLDLYNRATLDSLTNIPNRVLWSDRLDQALKKAKRYDELFAVLFIDLDGFKQISDNYGHQSGDLVLIEVTKRLSKKIRESDTLARIGGDEFCILMNNITRSEDASRLAQSVIDSAIKPIKIDGLKVQVGISIGICIYDDAIVEAYDMMKKADAAMYRAKTSGGNNYCFS
ncbi:MAG: diguanylate cyclase domain-containing protein [Bacteroidota bacterium]